MCCAGYQAIVSQLQINPSMLCFMMLGLGLYIHFSFARQLPVICAKKRDCGRREREAGKGRKKGGGFQARDTPPCQLPVSVSKAQGSFFTLAVAIYSNKPISVAVFQNLQNQIHRTPSESARCHSQRSRFQTHGPPRQRPEAPVPAQQHPISVRHLKLLNFNNFNPITWFPKPQRWLIFAAMSIMTYGSLFVLSYTRVPFLSFPLSNSCFKIL